MGNFRIVVAALGGHGVDRGKGNGETVDFHAGGQASPDSIAKRFVDELRANGCVDVSATITHWPGAENQVVDDLVTGVRVGSF